MYDDITLHIHAQDCVEFLGFTTALNDADQVKFIQKILYIGAKITMSILFKTACLQ